MEKAQREVLFAGIKGVIDKSCSLQFSKRKVKAEVKLRCSQFVPMISKTLMKSIIQCALSQYQAEKSLQTLNIELYKIGNSYGEILTIMQQLSN